MNTKLLYQLLSDNVVSLPSNERFTNGLLKLSGQSSIEEFDELVESSVDTIIRFPPARFTPDIEGVSMEDVANSIKKYNEYRNKIFVPSNHFVYVKLETGGFAGYDSATGKMGFKVFPVLRVVVHYKEHRFDEFINPNGSDEFIHETTKNYLERTQTLTKARNAPLNITEVNAKLEEFFRKTGLPSHDPAINRQVYLVSANSEFNKKFIDEHLPKLRFAAGPKPVDVNTIIANIEASGVPVVPLNVYGDDPHRYLDEMAATHNLLLQGLSYV